MRAFSFSACARRPFSLDERALERDGLSFLALEDRRKRLVADERGVLFPHLQFRLAKSRRAFRRGEDDRAAALEGPDFAGHSRDVGEVAALRQADEKVPVFEEIELAIEATGVEKRCALDEQRF